MRHISKEELEIKRAERKARLRDFGRNVKYKAEEALNWIEYYKEPIGIALAGTTIATKVGSKVVKAVKAEKADKLIYDPSARRYVKLNRRLTSSQKREISRRHSEGEKYQDIYNSMGILK